MLLIIWKKWQKGEALFYVFFPAREKIDFPNFQKIFEEFRATRAIGHVVYWDRAIHETIVNLELTSCKISSLSETFLIK